MQFRRSGQRDDRRRRILLDESSADNTEEQASNKLARSDTKRFDRVDTSQSYTDEALAGEQQKITDFVPSKGWKLALWVFSPVVAIAALDGLYYHFFLGSSSADSSYLKAFDLEQSSSLGAWFCSMLLLTAAAGSALIYKLRRHKIDDYRGRYRLWSWISVALLLAASDATTQWHRAISGLMAWLTGTSLYGNGDIWWMIVLGSAAAVLGVRLLFEVKDSKLAITSLILAMLGYLLTAAMKLNLLAPDLLGPVVLVQATTTMLAHTALFFTVASFARYVYLDSQGLILTSSSVAEESVESNTGHLSVEKKRAVKSEETKSTPRKRTDLESSPAGLSKRKTSSAKSVSKQATVSMEQGDEESSDKKLSKAERRRLRKQMRKEARQNRESEAA